jgi:hypothetical protein
VLLVADRFDNQQLRLAAIESLQRCTTASFRPAHKLYMAHIAKVTEWLRPAYETLVSTDVTRFTAADLEWMGPLTFLEISKIRSRLLARRQTLAVNIVEPTHTSTCGNNATCRLAWVTAWRSFMVYFAGGTDKFGKPITETQLHKDMVDTHPSMRPVAMGDCWEASINHLVEEDFFMEEYYAIKIGIDGLMKSD